MSGGSSSRVPSGSGVRPGARIAAKLHRHMCLIQTEDRILAEELLSRPRLANAIVGRITDEVLLTRPESLPVVLDELRAMGHTPRVV